MTFLSGIEAFNILPEACWVTEVTAEKILMLISLTQISIVILH